MISKFPHEIRKEGSRTTMIVGDLEEEGLVEVDEWEKEGDDDDSERSSRDKKKDST